MSELESVPVGAEESAPAPETAAPESGESSEDPSTSASPDSELSAVWKRMNPDREDDGKFTKNVPEGEQTDNETPSEGEKLPSGDPEIPVPQSWAADVAALWEKVPPEARSQIVKRETEAHKTITQQGQQLKAYQPISELVEQNRAVFDRYGVDAKTGINQLLNANAYLERDPINAIRDLAEAYGVDLRAYNPGQQNGQMAASPETAALKAEINDLRRQLQTTDHRLMGREQAEATQKLQTIENQVATFAADKPDFAELADDVEEQILALKAKQPHLDPVETLQKAYERARRINPTVSAKLEAEQKANAEKERLEAVKKRATEAKRAAPLSVASTPSNSHSPRSVDDTLRDVARKAYRK